MKNSISNRINVIILSVSVGILIVFLLGTALYEMKHMNRTLATQAQYLVKLSETALPTAVWNMDDKAISDILHAMSLQEEVVYLAVIDEDAKVLQKWVRPPFDAQSKFNDFSNTSHFFSISSPLHYDDETIATIQIALTNDLLKDGIYAQLMRMGLFTLLLLGIISMVSVVTTKKFIFKPLELLEDRAEAIASGDLETAITFDTDREDEVVRLGKVFERMRVSIKALLRKVNLINASLEEKVALRTKELDAIIRNTRESIEYASIIQSTLIPDNNLFRKYFQEYFVIWHPKDTVGGDIYVFEELRHDDECLIMAIDCTGHGVPGAFVTMLVMAIKRQLISELNHRDEEIHPGKILSIFNRSMRHLLKQDDPDSVCNAGFDGGILYYNRKEKIIRFAGAETPLFYLKDGELTMIKGSRHSVGYKKSNPDFVFKEHTIDVTEGMNFYLTTDGYLDQNGGAKGFCFGKKRFQNLIKEYGEETLSDQQEVFLYEMMEYQGDQDRNDDMTVIAFKV